MTAGTDVDVGVGDGVTGAGAKAAAGLMDAGVTGAGVVLMAWRLITAASEGTSDAGTRTFSTLGSRRDQSPATTPTAQTATPARMCLRYDLGDSTNSVGGGGRLSTAARCVGKSAA